MSTSNTTENNELRSTQNAQDTQKQDGVQQPSTQQQQQQPPKRTAFVHKLYAMLSDPNLSHLIWWSRNDDDCVFALHPGTEFANALTNYFKHGNVSSFVRQLHMYGFHKVFDTNNDDNDDETKENNSNNNNNNNSNNSSNSDDLIWEFRHSTGNFRKGDEASLAFIKRRSSNKLIPEDDLKNNRLTDTNVFYPQYHHHPPPPPEYISTQDPHIDQYYLQQQQQQDSAGPEYQRPQSPSSFTAGYQQIPRNHQYSQQQQRQSYGSSFSSQHSDRQYTPPPPVPTSLPQHQQQLPYNQGMNEIDHSHATNELIDQQRQIHFKSEYLNNELKTTVSDVLRFSDNIPKLAPVLKQQGHRYSEGFQNLRQSFNMRADFYKPSPLSAEVDHQLAHQQQLHQQQQYGSLPPPHPSAIPQHLQHQQQQQQQQQQQIPIGLRNQSIHFWESSGQRQPSVFVDPLNPSPQGSISSSSTSSGSRFSSSTAAIPSSASNPVYHISPSMKGSNSVPHIHYQSNQSPARRNESLPSNVPTGSTSPHAITSPQGLQRQLPPRSIPNERVNSGSIPNIAHLTSQLRPSVIEVHQNAIANAGPSSNPTQNTSVSSNSTYNTLYSANSSISSISSRNSYGSISAIYNEAMVTSPTQSHPQPYPHSNHPHHPHHQPHLMHHHHINRHSLQRTPSSSSRVKEIIDENPKSKLSVSSLLTSNSPDSESSTSGSKREIDGEEVEERQTLKRAKSVSDFQR